MSQHRLLFVCLGNICRSPIAQGVFAHVAEKAGLASRFEIDSAGTGAWHVGQPPDPRARQAVLGRGIDISDQVARQIRSRDFAEFDLLLAMDESNRETLLRAAPRDHAGKVRLFLEFAPGLGAREVPDPYYGGADGFERVIDLVEAGSRGLLDMLMKRD